MSLVCSENRTIVAQVGAHARKSVGRMKPKVLFVCIHNSARSQMAEAFLTRIADGQLAVSSAGITAGTLNPYVVQAMKEIGYDIAANVTKTVFDPAIRDQQYDYVITVCQESDAEPCPIFPTKGSRQNWRFDDPSKFTGKREEIIAKVREVRDEIRRRVERWYAGLGIAV